ASSLHSFPARRSSDLLLAEDLHPLERLAPVVLAPEDAPGLDVLEAHTPFESEHEDGVVEQVAQVVGVPALVARDADDAVSDIVRSEEQTSALQSRFDL